MTRQEQVRRLQVGLIRSMNATDSRGRTDDDLLIAYGEAAYPLAEALADVIHEAVKAS